MSQGVLNDWVLQLSHCFAESGLFENFKDEGICIARQVAGQNNFGYTSLFRFFGRFLALVLFHNMCMDMQLSSQLVKLIQGKKLSVANIKNGDEYLYNKFKTLLDEKTMNKQSWDDEYYEDWNWIPTVREKQQKRVALRSPAETNQKVEFADRKEYILKMAQARVSRGQWVIDAIRTGIEEVLPLEWLTAFTTDNLKLRLCGVEAPISINEWNAHAVFNDDRPEFVRSVRFFWEWIRDVFSM